MPLTLSLGRHLIAYLGESAPVYLPYAEMILIATLWGWVWREFSISIIRAFSDNSTGETD